MVTQSTLHSPALSFQPEGSSTRKLRTRAPRSYVISQLITDDLGPYNKSNGGSQFEKKSNSSASTILSQDEPSNPSIVTASVNNSKPTGRLLISHQHPVSAPPPIPSCSLSYLQSEKFPAWLLGDPMVHSSPNYLSKQPRLSSPPARSCSQPENQTSPIRRTGGSLLPSSPSKSRSSLDRHPSASSLRLVGPSTRRSSSPDEDLVTRREQFWEAYEYDTTAPHLQPRYFDKPLPSNEQWSDLDIQNVGVVPAPTEASPTIHLFEVFAPCMPDGSPDDEELLNQEDSDKKISATPFGFYFLPADYSGHQ